MNLTSCDSCGVVLDASKLAFPKDIYGENGCVDPAKGEYSQSDRDYLPYVSCPVCQEPVFRRSE